MQCIIAIKCYYTAGGQFVPGSGGIRRSYLNTSNAEQSRKGPGSGGIPGSVKE